MGIKLTEISGVGVRLTVKAVPGSSRDRIVGVLGDALKIAVRAAPENGKANRAIIALLATQLGVPERAVTVVRGGTSQRKEIHIAGLSAAEATTRLLL